MYRLAGEDAVFAWLSGQSSPEVREAFLAWLPDLAAAPRDVATFERRRKGVPALVAEVPATGTFVTYVIIEEHRIVLILDVVTPLLM